MPIINMCNNINEKAYAKLITRQIHVNLQFSKAKQFLEKWNIVLHPLEASTNFRKFFNHVEGETNAGIAWGVTMPKSTSGGGDIHCFINDTRNPFILKSNFTKISHELAHALVYISENGSGTRCKRQYDEPGARAGTVGACYVTKVHDAFYGKKSFRTYWVRYTFIWLPVRLLDIWGIIHGF